MTAAVEVSPNPSALNWQTVTPDLTETLADDPTTGDPVIRVKVDVTASATEFIRLRITLAPAPTNG